MSEEGGVMSSDMMRDVMPQGVTPVVGKGALGTWRALRRAGTGHRARLAVISVEVWSHG
jgi:hypothetical protein